MGDGRVRAECLRVEGADSTEVDENAPHKVIYKLRDLLGVDELGGTMRRYACELALRLGRRADLRGFADLRAPPPSIRVQLPVMGAVADRERDAGVRPLA